MELARGTEVDRYVVESVLGSGGMAAVYLVRHARLNALYALKVLTMASKAVEERLVREGQVQAGLRHPNIVSVVDILTVQGRPALVMEYVDGPPLDVFLEGRQLDHRQGLLLCQGILAGVRAAHEAGVVHRDLKPANVLLQLGGDTIVPKVTDFGLAKVASPDLGASQTRSGVTMGTPRYMAPEQIRNAKNADALSDIFALGCILYEVLTGHRTFPGEDMLEIFMRIGKGEYTPVAELAPGLPPAAVRAIEGALETDKSERIASVSELQALIAEALQQCGPATSAGFSRKLLDEAHSMRDRSASSQGAPSIERAPSYDTLSPDDAVDDSVPTTLPFSILDGPEKARLKEGPLSAPPAADVAPEPAPVSEPRPDPPKPQATRPSPEPRPSRDRSMVETAATGGAVAVFLAGGGAAAIAVVAALGLLAIGGAWILGAFDPEPAAVDDPQVPAAPREVVDTAVPKKPAPQAPVPDEGDGVVDADPTPTGPDCSDAASFQDAAAKGALSGAERACLVRRMKSGSLDQVQREQAGRVVIADAWARCESGDCSDYEAHQPWFFEEVTRSDAEQMYVWATWRAKTGQHADAVTWARRALERRDQWKDADTHIQRVEALYATLAESAFALHQADPNSGRARTNARNSALEWINYRIELRRGYDRGMEICSAAASRESCEKQIYEEHATIPITFVSLPNGASVRVDGKDQCTAPCSVELILGPHTIELVDGSASIAQEIEVGAKENRRWIWRSADGTMEGQLQ